MFSGIAAVILLLSLSGRGLAAGAEYSPPVANDNPTRVFWGDTHVHTSLSADAFSMGNRSMGPEQAYRFARGETVTAQGGVKARLARPLDFLMVADHADFLGVFPRVYSRSPDIIDTRLGRRWVGHVEAGADFRVMMEFAMLAMGIGRAENLEQYVDESHGVDLELLESLHGLDVEPELQQSIWDRVGEVADQFNEPGLFTAFIGYEWTSTPDGNNLHRNVMFRDGPKKTSQVVPFSSVDSSDPEDLWRYMGGYEEQTGGNVLAIPHNGNLSNGLMFAETTLAGEPLDKDYAERRARWEPVMEVTQLKGDSEAHPFLSPNDEFADFENWDRSNLFTTAPKEPGMLEFEYSRSALKNGLALEQSLGVNPFHFGMIGSTDAHTSLTAAAENNFFGKMTNSEPAKGRAAQPFTEGELESDMELMNWELNAGGYAAVWARENTREALFDAIKRRETYATTGPRMSVRFFGGWEFVEGDAQRSNFADFAYEYGVPMGADLPSRQKTKTPRFLVSAMKDPIGANLDRIQVIKGWLDGEGKTHEKVYNVAASDARPIRANQLAVVGNTVDAASASYRNSIGDAQLATVWQDPDFDPAQRAFYYVRVLEIPTPRWTTYDAAFFGEAAPKDAPAFIQERAYTSPIWYSPPH